MPGRNQLELETLEIIQDKIEALKGKLQSKLPEGYGLEIVTEPQEPKTFKNILNDYNRLTENNTILNEDGFHTHELSQQFYSGHYLSGKEKRRLRRAEERRKKI